MSRSLAQKLFLLIAVSLFITHDCHAMQAQGFNSAAAAATDGESSSDKQSPDITGLVRECDRHGALMHRSLPEYTYNLVKVKRTLDDHGKVMRELVQSFEAYPIQGQHVLIQISQNGSALSPREVAEERRLAGEELEKAEREAHKRFEEALKNYENPPTTATAVSDEPGRYLLAGVFVSYGGKYTNILIDLSEFLRSCEFSSPRRELVNKREVIALSFRPRADVKFPAQMAFISKLNGTVWIDLADKVVTRLEGWPLQKSAPEQSAAHEAQPASDSEPAVIYQQVRLSTGVWVPSLIRMNAGGNAALFNGLNWDVMFQFKDYKRFSTDVGGIELEKPKKHP
jgi:hypothetical protein